MDTLDYIFLFVGIAGGILYVACDIIIKIDDNMTDREISYFCNLIGIRYNTWYHPVCRRLSKEHYTFAVNLDKSKFFFCICEVVGIQLALFKTCVLPVGLNLLTLVSIFCVEFMVLMVAVPHFYLFYYSYEKNSEYHKKLHKRKR